MMKKYIECFSYVHGKKNVNQIIKDLNSLKSDKSLPFILSNDGDDCWLILGTVTEEDWTNLNLESDFMRI